MPKCLQPHTGFLEWMSEDGQDGHACQQGRYHSGWILSLCSSCRNTLFIGRDLKVGGACVEIWKYQVGCLVLLLSLWGLLSAFRYQQWDAQVPRQWDAQVPCVQWLWVCLSPVHTILDSSFLDYLSYEKWGKIRINSWHTVLFGIMTRLLCLPHRMPAEPLLLPSTSFPFLGSLT